MSEFENPDCHGCAVASCRACPDGKNTPDFQEAVFRGKNLLAEAEKLRKSGDISLANEKKLEAEQILLESWKKLRNGSPLVGVTARVCRRYCESGCSQTSLMSDEVPDREVSPEIRDAERWIDDFAWEREWYKKLPIPEKTNDKKIAIIGSGPGGLSAAWQAVQLGYGEVTIYDRGFAPEDPNSEDLRQFGGLLRMIPGNDDPKSKLPNEVVDRELRLLQKMGVKFVRREIRSAELSELESKNDRVLIAIGKEIPVRLHPEETVAATDFLRNQAKKDLGIGKFEKKMSARDKKILIVGSQNVADDVAKTARDQGASEIVVAVRRSEGSWKQKRLNDPPAYSEAEMGDPDRRFSTEVLKIENRTDGKVDVFFGDSDEPEVFDMVVEALGSDSPDFETTDLETTDLVKKTREKVWWAVDGETPPDSPIQKLKNHEKIYIVGDAAHGEEGREDSVTVAIGDGKAAVEHFAECDRAAGVPLRRKLPKNPYIFSKSNSDCPEIKIKI